MFVEIVIPLIKISIYRCFGIVKREVVAAMDDPALCSNRHFNRVMPGSTISRWEVKD
jgi:hypothetical protein